MLLHWVCVILANVIVIVSTIPTYFVIGYHSFTIWIVALQVGCFTTTYWVSANSQAWSRERFVLVKSQHMMIGGGVIVFTMEMPVCPLMNYEGKST